MEALRGVTFAGPADRGPKATNRELVVRAFPPVAVLLINTAPALEPRADLVAPLARLQCLGVLGDTGFALRIRGEPPCNYWSLRVGRAGKSENEAEGGKRERDGEDHSPTYWRYANQVDLCNRIIAWFDSHLKHPIEH